MLLGGGQLVRGDPLGPAFPPASREVHDPLGIWLVPTVTALLAGVPVAWNAPGVSPTIPERLDPLVAAVVAGVRHLVVRDEQSSLWLAERAGVEARVSPDTAFALAGHPRPPLGAEAAALLADAGVGGPYVVLQPTSQLDPWRDEIEAALRGVEVLELPIGPVGGDYVPLRWPSPWAIAELIANASGAVGMSYHLGVTATAFGVPLLRPPSPPGWKYELLETLPGVTVLGRGETVSWGAGAPSPEARALAGAVEAHWDAVAALAVSTAPRRFRRRRPARRRARAGQPGRRRSTLTSPRRSVSRSASKCSSSAWAYLREVPSSSRKRARLTSPSASSSATSRSRTAASASAWTCIAGPSRTARPAARSAASSSAASRSASSGGSAPAARSSSSTASAAGVSAAGSGGGRRRRRGRRGRRAPARRARAARAARARSRAGPWRRGRGVEHDAAAERVRRRERRGSRAGRPRGHERLLEPQLRVAAAELREPGRDLARAVVDARTRAPPSGARRGARPTRAPRRRGT